MLQASLCYICSIVHRLFGYRSNKLSKNISVHYAVRTLATASVSYISILSLQSYTIQRLRLEKILSETASKAEPRIAAALDFCLNNETLADTVYIQVMWLYVLASDTYSWQSER